MIQIAILTVPLGMTFEGLIQSLRRQASGLISGKNITFKRGRFGVLLSH